MKTIRAGIMVAAIALTASACATSEEWAEWKSHTSHFASGDHFSFSMKNKEGSTARVSRKDIAAARDQGWWGKAISVNQSDILEN